MNNLIRPAFEPQKLEEDREQLDIVKVRLNPIDSKVVTTKDKLPKFDVVEVVSEATNCNNGKNIVNPKPSKIPTHKLKKVNKKTRYPK